MVDIRRLKEAWEIFRDSNPYGICNGKEFRAINEPEYCMGQMVDDTLELLKEHEQRINALQMAIERTQKPTKLLDVFGKNYAKIVRCKDCKHGCGRGHGLYCQFIACEKTGAFHKEDWFCADGKRWNDDD